MERIWRQKPKVLCWICCYCCSVAKSCLTLCSTMDCSTPGFPVLHYLPESEVAQSCPTLWDPMGCRGSHGTPCPPGSSVHGILQARILEWVAISFSMGSSWPRDWTQVSHIAGRCFNLWATREARLSSRACSNSHPLTWWCYLTILSSATPFSFCLQC